MSAWKKHFSTILTSGVAALILAGCGTTIVQKKTTAGIGLAG